MIRKKMLTMAILTALAGCGSDDIGGGVADPSVNQQQDDQGNQQYVIDPDSDVVDTSLLAPKYHKFPIQELFSKKKTFHELDKRYFRLEVLRDKSQTSLNHIEYSNGLRTVILKGRKVVFKNKHSQRLLEQITNSYDLKELIIMVDTLEVHDQVKIPSTNVIIKAKKIVFKDNGSFNTTPEDYKNRAAQFKDGARGANAGNISVTVKDLIIDESIKNPVFVMNGGKGQNAGHGQAGTQGRSMRNLGGNVVYRSKEREHCIREPIERHDRFKMNKIYMCDWSGDGHDGHNAWPGNGGNATAGGYPGNPGDGGTLTLNTQIDKKLVSNIGGQPGREGGSYEGGAPGSPSTAYHYRRKSHYFGKVEDIHTGTHQAQKGKGAKSPAAKIKVGQSGQLTIASEKTNWINDGYSEFNYLYATDLYIANRLNKADQIYKVLKEDYRKFEKKKIAIDPEVALDYQKAVANSYQIRGHLDYFGHSGTWVPSLSLEANYKAYETEVDRSMRILYLTYWLQNVHRSLEEKAMAIGVTQDQIYERILEDGKKHDAFAEKIPLIAKKVEDIKVDEKRFQEELARVEAEINRMAENNIISRKKSSFLKKMLKLTAAVSTIIPAGQPALGAIGIAIGSAVRISESDKKWDAIIDEAPNLYKAYGKFDLEKSSKDWNKQWSKIKYSHYKTLKTDKEKKAYLKNLGKFSKPIIKAVAQQAKQWKQQEAPRSEFEAEVLKIKNSHPMFNELTNRLRELVAKREILAKEILSLNKEMLTIINEINSGFETIGDLAISKSQFHKGIDSNLIKSIVELERASKKRLLKYHYRMARAFEYRLLRPYNENLQIDKVIDKMKELIHAGKGSDLSKDEFDTLKGLYEEKLSNIVNEVVDQIQKEGRSESRSKDFRLTKSEIATLNNGHTIYLDIPSLNLFDNDIEDIRLNDILVEDMEVEMEGEPLRHSEAILEISYSGESYLQRSGKTYFFEFENINNSSNLRWGATQNALTGETEQIRPSMVEQSLLRQLLDMDDDKVLLMSRPGALTQLKIRLKTKTDNGSTLKLKKASLQLDYDYRVIK